MTVIEILWLMLASAVVGGAMIILSALVTGYLVFRAKRETYETLLPPAARKAKGKPIVVDEFESEQQRDDEKGLPDVITKMNATMAAQLAAEANRK